MVVVNRKTILEEFRDKRDGGTVELTGDVSGVFFLMNSKMALTRENNEIVLNNP